MFAKSKTYRRFIPIPEDEIPMYRYALGSSLVAIIALSISLNLAYIIPVLALNFFAPGSTMPNLKQGLGFVFIIASTILAGLLLTHFFMDMVWFFIPVHALTVLWVFYTNKLNGASKAFMLIALLLVPMLGMQSMKLAHGFSITLIAGAGITILMVWIVFTLIPEIQNSVNQTADQKTKKQVSQTKEQRFTYAINTLLIVFPVVLFFFFYEMLGSLLILIFVALLSMNPAFTFKAGMMMVLGNLLGGLFAIIAFNLLVMVPEYPFFILLMILAGLFFALQLFSKKPTAPLYGMGFSTFLLIIGQTTTSTDDAGGKVWLRVLQLTIAVGYVVIAFAVQNAFRKKKMEKLNKKIAKTD